MTFKENIEQMMGAIANKDTDTATNIFQSIISQKVADRLEDEKVGLSYQYFNGFKEGALEEQ